MRADTNQSNAQDGTFPLLMASQSGHAECVQALLAMRADTNQSNAHTGAFTYIFNE